MKPEDLTIEIVENAIDLPASKWEGKCYGIACLILRSKLVEGHRDQLRAMMMRPCPEADPNDKTLVEKGWKFSPMEEITFCALTKTPVDKITIGQAFWIANLPYAAVANSISSIYPAFGRNGFTAAIPIDNWRRAVREGFVEDVE